MRNPSLRDGGIRVAIQAPRGIMRSVEASEGGRIAGPAGLGPCAVAEHRRHEMRPGEGRGEACRKVGRIAEARVISLMAEDKADRDVLLAQRARKSVGWGKGGAVRVSTRGGR